MQELGRHVHDHTQILFGTAVDGRMGNRLSVTIISSLTPEAEVAPQSTVVANEPMPAPAPPPTWEEPESVPPVVDIIPDPITTEPPPALEEIVATPVSIEAQLDAPPEPAKPPPAPRVIVPKKKPLPPPEVKPPPEKSIAKQEVLQFEPVTRGRFEKSEPTIVEGQDLDVPTFLRKNIRVK